MGNVTVLDPWEQLFASGKLRSLGPIGYLATSVYLATIGIIATFGNGLVCYVILRSKKLRSRPHNMLLVNMAFSDLCITAFGYPYTTISGFANKYMFGWVYCKMQGFLTFTFAQSSMNTLAVISIYRYVSVCKPHLNYKLTVSMTQFVLFLTWLYTVLWTAPPLFGWSRYTIEPFGTSCSIDWTSANDWDVAYVYCLVVFCYLVHIAIMSFSYYKIVKKSATLRMNTRKTMDLDEAKQVHKMKVEIKVTGMCLTMVIIFTIVWSPYTFVCLWSVYDPNLPIWTTTLPTMFAKLASMLNPFIYVATNRSFKDAAKELIFARRNRIHAIEDFRRKRRTTEKSIYTIDRTKEGIYIGVAEVKISTRDTTFF
ncbi:opsin-5-like [Haliotis rufescens]|uniref:opsin-5-like n=1 Tax=Haliotis rufescens TaxID=6454 RepID=UPI00201F728A|nr:opsin-5-like [Haliotis rufescens]